ncbi:unnamed protein product [Rotaria socialis]|uniref:Uncharacterized protein n=1 Tax=Rotaria socialis TaxID=392032 RepID=A0A820NLT4_9BILA|nr:unnamed protein product [Rotaria socialis]CAF4390852.1 unnamed protein product [Rotaria socialis]
MLMNSFGASRKRPLGTDKENVWSSMLGIEVDTGVATKQPRLALGSAILDNNIFNSIPYSPPDSFFIKSLEPWSPLKPDSVQLAPAPERRSLNRAETRYKNGSFRQVLKSIRSLGEYGDGNNAFREPNSVAWLERGKLAVVDTNAHCIKVFDSETGQFEYSFGRGRTMGCQNLLYPYRIAVVPGGSDQLVVIQRHPRPQIHIFTCTGEFIRRFGQHLEKPRALTVDKSYRIIVIESQIQKLHIFSLDGQILSLFNLSEQLKFPTSICSNNSEIFISDNHLHSVKVFSYHGQLLREIKEDNYIMFPTNIKLNIKGQLIIIDNHQGLNITVYDEYEQRKRLGAYTARICHSQILDVTIESNQKNILHLASKDYRVYTYQMPFANEKSKRPDDTDIIEPISPEAVAPEAQIHLHADDAAHPHQHDDKSTAQEKTSETKSEKDEDENIDDLNDSLHDLIIEYRIKEQEKKNAKKSQENEENVDAEEDDDDDDDDDANLQRVLKQIGVSLHKKYHQKQTTDQSTKLSAMIQDLYQTIKTTRPHLFTKATRNDDRELPADTNLNEETKDVDETDEEENIPLTPEMDRANNIYHQAMKLINVTVNRQYEAAYKLFKEAADIGHIGAKEELAFAHLIGVHLPMNFNQAKLYFDQGAELGSPPSHFGLYFLNSAGLIPNASIPKALVHLSFAAVDGYNPAQMALGYRYWRTVSLAHSCESALMFYKQVATYVSSKMTSATGQLIQRIRLYDEEEHPTQNNIMVDEDLVQYYQLLADRGDAQAQYGLGQLYYLRDTAFDKALYYFRLAAENGNSNAMAYLGKLYAEKNEYVKQNNFTALQFFQRSAEKGNPIGQSGIGMAFYHGAGVDQSYEKAFKYFQLSADQGYVEGQLMLGIMYYKGEGVKRDYKMAIKCFQAASQSGHALGYYNLGQMHATGTGVLRSCTTATELFKNVAERGKWSSMFIEAYNLYRQGHIEQAFMKYLYLAELGYEVAQSNAAYLLDQMPNQLTNIYSSQEEQYRRALTYWNRAATQGFHTARVKLGDYFYYGYGTEQNYEAAAIHYKSATEQSQNSQAMFNLAYMHEKGLGLKRDIHLAKRFYDMAAETSADAYLPVSIVLFKLHLELLWEKFSALFFSSSTEPIPTSSTTPSTVDVGDNHSTSIELDSSWDLYLMAALLGLIGALYTIRRQRAILHQQQQQQPAQVPVQ